MSEVVVGPVSVDGPEVRCEVECAGSTGRFFARDAFEVTYDVDVEEVPERLLVAPTLAQVCPVAWATGADVRVPAVDGAFLDSLREVRDVLREMYPAFVEGGSIRADRVVAPEPEPGAFDRSGLLFTGGVDSLATYLRHRGEDPLLVSLQGWVVSTDEDDRWAGVEERIDSFAAAEGRDATVVRADVTSFLHTPLLNAHFKHHVDGSWYSAVGHGLGLLGTCAPLAHAEGLGRVYIASSHWEGFPAPAGDWDGRAIPWGSHPDIDDRIAWAGTRASHDGFELTRQEKVELIADAVRDGEFDPVVRACTRDSAGGNCTRCEKCARTAVGLLLAGLDPADHGYDIDEAWFDRVVEQFETGGWVLDEHTAAHWVEMQRSIDLDADYPYRNAEPFLQWMAEASFPDLVSQSLQPLRDRLLRAGVRHTPHPIYTFLYGLYTRADPAG